MKRLNITLPDAIARRLGARHNKSRFIAEAVEEKIEREERASLERLMAQGYAQEAEEDEKLSKDWEKADIEGWE